MLYIFMYCVYLRICYICEVICWVWLLEEKNGQRCIAVVLASISILLCNINNIFMFIVVVIVEVQICGGAVQKNSVVYRWYMMGLNPCQTGGNESNKR
jgi:hypothetical protein